jgi:mannose-6-phosphate isomerase-like protein (cupin superfamily)
MFVKKLQECRGFTATDGTFLKELLHRKNDDVNLRYSLAHARLAAGHISLRHRLRTSEVYYILKGRGIMHIDDESREVSEGCAVYIPPNAVQHMENVGKDELEFLCIIDPAWRPEDEEIVA